MACSWPRHQSQSSAGASGRRASLSSLIWPSVLARSSFEEAVAYRVSVRLGSEALGTEAIRDAFAAALAAHPEIGLAMRQDARAVLEGDPVGERVLDPVLHF